MELASREEWRVVVRRRRSKQRPATSCREAALSQLDEATSSSHPNSFLNTFSFCNPSLDGIAAEIAPAENRKEEKRLMAKMEKVMASMATSVFFTNFCAQLRALNLPETLRAPTGSTEAASGSVVTLNECSIRRSAYPNVLISDGVSMEIVVYGVGSILTSEVSRNQLSLALLMREKFFCAAKILVFDPVLTSLEWNVMATLGCSMLVHNEQGRRTVKVPTIFYLPHCEVSLYDNLLQSNWGGDRLCRLAILGNSFRVYQERWATSPNPRIARPDYVLQGQRHVEEHPVDASSFAVESAFNDTSWHLFPFEPNHLFQPLRADVASTE